MTTIWGPHTKKKKKRVHFLCLVAKVSENKNNRLGQIAAHIVKNGRINKSQQARQQILSPLNKASSNQQETVLFTTFSTARKLYQAKPKTTHNLSTIENRRVLTYLLN